MEKDLSTCPSPARPAAGFARGFVRGLAALRKACTAVVLIPLLFCTLLSSAARAQEPGVAGALSDALTEQVRQMAIESSGGSEAPAPGMPRVEIEIGKLDPRLKLAPCLSIEPHLPPGTKLWGRTRIGLRCVKGPTAWNVYLPLQVKVFGRGLVAGGAIPAGAVIKAGDLVEAEIDIAAEAGMVVSDNRLAVGRVLMSALQPGESLRQTDLKPRQYFAAGDTVVIRASGAGFSASGEGLAMTHGVEGRIARVRIDNGRILSGIPVADRRIEVRL